MAEIHGNNDPNILVGGSDSELIKGFDGDDAIYGLQGNDTLDGGRGADTLHGGDGIDFVDYFWSGPVIVNLTTNRGAVSEAYGDEYVSIEGALGSGQGDWLIGNDLDNIFDGRGGGDVIDAGGGHDTLYGGAGNDFVYAGAGVDVVHGGSGADFIDGGEGLDFALFIDSSAGVVVDLSAGTASGGDADGDTIYNVEKVFGSSYSDSITGDAGNNTLWGYYGGFDTLNGGGGNDTINGSGILNGNSGNDELYSDHRYATIMQGNEGQDILVGSFWNDTVSGGKDNDTLSGDLGADQLRGGLGADIFRYSFKSDSAPGFATQDQIFDFSRAQGDRISVKSLFDNPATSVDDPMKFIGTSAFHGVAGELRFLTNTAQNVSFVQADLDGDRSIDLQVRLTGVIAFTAGDFIL